MIQEKDIHKKIKIFTSKESFKALEDEVNDFMIFADAHNQIKDVKFLNVYNEFIIVVIFDYEYNWKNNSIKD